MRKTISRLNLMSKNHCTNAYFYQIGHVHHKDLCAMCILSLVQVVKLKYIQDGTTSLLTVTTQTTIII